MKTSTPTVIRKDDRRVHPWRVPVLTGLVLASCLALAPAVQAQQTWTNGGGDGLWSNLSNWAGGTPGIYRFFNDTGVGASTANAYRGPIWWLQATNSTGTHAVNLSSGTLTMQNTQIEIGLNATGAMQFSNGTFSGAQAGSQPLRLGRAQSAAANGTLIGTSSLVASMGFNGLSTVGYADSTFNGSATLDMADSDGGSLTFANLRAGYANTTGVATSTMSFGDNWTFNVGTSGARAELSAGYAASTGTAGSSFTAGSGGNFTAYTNTLNIGSGANTTTKSSTVNLSGINGGTLDHSGGNGSFNVGRGAGSGSLVVGSGWTMNWNVAAAYIGYDGGTGSITGTNMILSGSIPYLYVGVKDSAGTGGYGTLDMGGGSMGSGLTISTSFRIGSTGDSTGTVKFGSGLVAMNGTADVGDGGASGVEGLLELRGTQFTAGASAVVNVQNSGRLNILVSNTSSGLILDRANSGALTIADTVTNGNGILATFLNNPTGFSYPGTAGQHDSIYWAIKWAGDQSSTLTSLISADKVEWDVSGLTGGLAGATPEVIYDAGTNATYLGIYVSAVPEPGTLALAAGGAVVAGWSMIRRRRGPRAA